MLRVTNVDVPLPYAANLEKLALIKVEDVVKAAKAVTLSLSVTDRDLVRLYWPVELRPAFDALFGIDDALAEVVATATQPALGAIRLAWWREALERLDASPPPPEPRLQAAATELLPRGISGATLWPRWRMAGRACLTSRPDPERVGDAGRQAVRDGRQAAWRERPSGWIAAGRLYALATGSAQATGIRSRHADGETATCWPVIAFRAGCGR